MFHLTDITKQRKENQTTFAVVRYWMNHPTNKDITYLNWIDERVFIIVAETLLFNSIMKHYNINKNTRWQKKLKDFRAIVSCTSLVPFNAISFWRFHSSESNFINRLNIREHLNYAISWNKIQQTIDVVQLGWKSSCMFSVINFLYDDISVKSAVGRRWRFNF